MNKINRIIKLSGINQLSWLNPLFLALFPAIIIIWLQPIQFSPLIFELSDVRQNSSIWFVDLENDGKSERFVYENERTEGHASIRYYNDKDQYIGQYNFEHSIAETRTLTPPYEIDVNNNGVEDLVFATQNKDSLFLDAFDYLLKDGIVKNRFITKIGGFNKHLDYYVNFLGQYDTNNDSIPELYLSVAAGFALYPRRVFRYDFANDSLIASINTGAGYLPGKIFEHNDSLLIVIGSSAYENISDGYPYPYHDTTTWLFIFDKNLRLASPPKNYGIAPGGIEFPVFKDGYIYYLFASNNAEPENKLLKMNIHGEVVDSIVFDFYISKSFSHLRLNNKMYHYVLNSENQEYLNFDIGNFSIQKNRYGKSLIPSRVIEQIDLNKDSRKEILVYQSLTKQLLIYDHHFRLHNNLFTENHVKFLSANYYNESNYGKLIANLDNQVRTYRYYENPYYFFQYPLYLGIYIVSFLFVSIIQYFQNRRIQKQKVLEEQLADLQLQNLRNQLDPHFTFNVLNSVGNAIYKQDKEGAYDLFQRFTRIIRSSLMSSDKVFRPLKEELQFTQDYLEFQQLRFKGRFNYTIEVEKGIEPQTIRIPKMLIQGFAENAVKHAFYGVDYTGQITIRVLQFDGTQHALSGSKPLSAFKHGTQKLKIIIEDNGIGITRSKQLKATSGTQKGLEVLKEQVRQINRIYGTSYSIQIEDRMLLNPKTEGTKVKIEFPFKA